MASAIHISLPFVKSIPGLSRRAAILSSRAAYSGVLVRASLTTPLGLAHAVKIAPSMSRDKALLVNLSGRGDKDMNTVARLSGIEL